MNELFLAGTTLFFAVLLKWGFTVLPRENWQFAAAYPQKCLPDGSWEGINLTYYGLFNAVAHMSAFTMLFVLTGAVGIAASDTVLIFLLLIGVCVPSSHILAKLIEKKAHTFSVGAASFVGILLGPLIIWTVYAWRHSGMAVPFTPILAAMGIAYSIGEGVGRLACISFGCCYGKPLADCPRVLQKLFKSHSIVFHGATKKIAYEKGLEGLQIFPIQAVTSSLYTAVSLIASYLYLQGLYGAAFMVTIAVTQLWRPLSEFLRADYRGKGRISAYQILALAAFTFAFCLWLLLPASPLEARIANGLDGLWHPAIILLTEFLGAAIFLYTGRSQVTGVRMSFYVHKERI